MIQPLSEDTDTKYLYYSIGLKLHQMKANASGTATKFLTQPILNNINIEYRDIEEQKGLQIFFQLTTILSKTTTSG